ncbi:MAG: redoxin family protein [Thaumarchaeota archaeon]|nr:redoxin family protein [Nitrososphaerota archaeon]MBI3641613.1 redoxin family protein [Nitrososphaerota archaeon]
MSEDSMMKDHNMANENVENKSMTKTMPGDNMKTPNDSNQMSQSSMDESKYSDAPAFVGISDYINTTPAKLAQDMKGKVIVYDFWTYTCINCIHTLPHVVDLNNKYLSKDVLVIGIHSPEFEFEKDINNVKSAVAKYGIKYPVVLDNDHQTWDAFGNHYWPHIYIADAQGKLRYDHIGEGAYDEIDNTVASLLLEQENQKPKELVMG